MNESEGANYVIVLDNDTQVQGTANKKSLRKKPYVRHSWKFMLTF